MSDTTAHVYSPAQLTFFATALKSIYQLSGSWPVDAVPVSDQTFEKYGLNPPPIGFTRGSDDQGQPIWVALPPLATG